MFVLIPLIFLIAGAALIVAALRARSSRRRFDATFVFLALVTGGAFLLLRDAS